ncbi:MAG: hypothetical protein WCJ74_02705 [bacterium]
MEKQTLNEFKDGPKTKIAWWAMGLGMSTILLMPLLGVFGAFISPRIADAWGERVQMVMGFIFAILVISFLIFTLVVNIRAFRKGERSWILWLGFVPVILETVFFVFMIIGEFLLPH